MELSKTAVVIAFDSARRREQRKPEPPQPSKNASGLSAHKWLRVSFVLMFGKGRSVRRIARFHQVAEATVENELRAVIFDKKAA